MLFGPRLATAGDIRQIGDWNALGPPPHVHHWEVRRLRGFSSMGPRFCCRCGESCVRLVAEDAGRVTGDYHLRGGVIEAGSGPGTWQGEYVVTPLTDPDAVTPLTDPDELEAGAD